MKKLFIKLFLFAIIFFVLDQAIGASLTVLVGRASGGDTGRNTFIADKTTAQVILMGSSRCIHHYDPRMIADSLGWSCYNAGRDGNGILMMYPYFKMLASRYTPKLIIYDLSTFDEDKKDNSKYLVWLRQFYGRPVVDSVVWAINSDERYKMLSQAYRYNGKALQIVSDAFHPQQHDILGYRPLQGSMSYSPKITPDKATSEELEPLKRHYLIRLIQDCKNRGIKLVFMISPTYGHYWKSPFYDSITSLCKENGVPFFYYENDPEFITNKNLFKDSSHLNEKGATKYTNVVIERLRSLGYGQ